MREVRHKRWISVFGAVAFLVLAQVIWWTWVFTDNVSLTAKLRLENLHLAQQVGTPTHGLSEEQIQSEAFHRRLMFLSESSFFILLMCLGFYLLFRALKIEERSRAIQKNFIEILSHESKTPVTALKLRLEALSEMRVKDVELKQEIDLALEEVRRLTELFRKSMNFNRLERGVFSFKKISVTEIVEDVLNRLRPLAQRQGIQLRLQLDREARVKGDLSSLQNSIQSLIENSILYNTNIKKEIVVQVSRLSSKIQLDVQDNGPGIDSRDRPHIFERFYRGKTGNGIPGTGLGLFIAKTIVEYHHGSLRLVDPPQGKTGAHFQIELPAVS